MAVDLVRPGWSIERIRQPLLNAAVLLVAVVAGLFAAVRGAGDGASLPWIAAGAGTLAVFLGGFALAWREGSIHLRAALAGGCALLLHALALLLLKQSLPVAPGIVLPVFLLASLIGLRILMRVRHPLALFVGFDAALLLPFWIVPGQADLQLPYLLAVNLGLTYGSLTLRRLQPGALGALLSLSFLGAGSLWAAPVAGLLALTCLVQALVAPFLHARAGKTAILLAGLGFGLVEWSVYALHQGPPLIKAAGLFVPATVAVLVALRLPPREGLLGRVLKFGAILLLVSALPLGFQGRTLAWVVLLAGLLAGLYAYFLADVYLKAGGALLLAAGITLALRAGLDAPAAFTASLVAFLLLAVRSRGREPAALPLVLGAVAHAGLLAGTALALPASVVAYLWAGIGLAWGVAASRRPGLLLRAGASSGAGSAAIWALWAVPAGPGGLALLALLLAPHFWLCHPLRAPRLAGLHLLLAELVLLGALHLALPGPWAVFATLAALPVMAAPIWGVHVHILRAHARFVSLVLVLRCLVPDMLWARFDAMRLLATLATAAAAVAAYRLARRRPLRCGRHGAPIRVDALRSGADDRREVPAAG